LLTYRTTNACHLIHATLAEILSFLQQKNTFAKKLTFVKNINFCKNINVLQNAIFLMQIANEIASVSRSLSVQKGIEDGSYNRI
jgi:hypothetical protein